MSTARFTEECKLELIKQFTEQRRQVAQGLDVLHPLYLLVRLEQVEQNTKSAETHTSILLYAPQALS